MITESRMKEAKRIALVAHDERKKDLLEWVKYNASALRGHRIYATGTTGRIIAEVCDLEVGDSQAVPWEEINNWEP